MYTLNAKTIVTVMNFENKFQYAIQLGNLLPNHITI